jgi:cell division inhibitor SepF
LLNRTVLATQVLPHGVSRTVLPHGCAVRVLLYRVLLYMGMTEDTMASAMRKMAVYLGLVEDDQRYDDPYPGEYGDGDGDDYADYVADYTDPGDAGDQAGVRDGRGSYADRGGEGTGRADPRATEPAPATDLARITTLHPRTYNEARTIGEHFREGTPVIMNLTEMVDSDAKRLVDFSAGLIFGLRGSIERVTNKVFLLSPANVEVTAEDKARIAERGFFNQS